MPFCKKIELFDNNKVLKFVDSQLQPINDVELLFLKGHLVIEHLFNEIIVKFSKADDHQKLLRLKFAEKLTILEFIGLFSFNRDVDLLKQLTMINTIRNKLSHNLNYDKNSFNALIGEFNHFFSEMQSGGKIVPITVIGKLELVFIGVIGHVIGRVDSLIVMNNEYAKLTDQMFKQTVFELVKKYVDDNPVNPKNE
jgi:hypothetical protein